MLEDKQTGIAIRFIRAFNADRALMWTVYDQAVMLASADDRPIAFTQRLADALVFLKRRVH